jgi:hypothetical protein
MDKLRFNLLIGLVIIFIFTISGFLISLVGSGSISGSAVTGSGKTISMSAIMFIPGLLFIGFLILTVFYLENRYCGR